MKKVWNIGVKLAFGAYCILMIWLLFGQRMGASSGGTYWEQLWWNINLVPFRTVTEFTTTMASSSNPHLARHAVINLLGNIVMFVPLGFFLPCIWDWLRQFRRCMAHVAVTIVVIELIQLFTLLGSCDVDDLILNVLGAAIGYGVFHCVSVVVKRKTFTLEEGER